ncbi:Galactosyl transferase GMA12/MNN10 family protein isoform 1 [Tripterygium wilfordii]|uniref:Galactosyl transferase GMA12/MNN10 family protein isoform 1 n=1 Tax=Tripterygium wilfordii TaxID=458696 RepID=A0A7J7C9K4_TRIWF|nr:putative glycosyltransferase 7 [Tripterygium wilfordii]KAF5730792.1 Galactosyl transferase GMA12/MNN10 family protein isoform 1 [Tripterygium wilfordii]
MVSPDYSRCQASPMAKHTVRNKASAYLADGFLFLGGAFLAVLIFWFFWSFTSPSSDPNLGFETTLTESKTTTEMNCQQGTVKEDITRDPPDETFYDDPELTYSLGKSITDWDEKRKEWLKRHPSFIKGARDRVVMVTGSQPSPCKNPIGDHMLLRFFKNKVDYCRIHGYDIFYNSAVLQPVMKSYWGKLPVVRAAMLAHPEAEWIWWVDSDALFTDMEFKLPFERYRNHNLVVHGWENLIYQKRSWTALNAGVFLIRNCQWSMDFMDVWASMGPMTPDYDKWGQILQSTFKDKLFPESDDQTALIYLLYKERDKYWDNIYLEGEYYLEGYWVDIVPTYANISGRYDETEMAAPPLRRRHAEKVSEQYGAFREKYLEGAGNGRGSWRRPFVTHFTGCQPCSGNHNKMYAGETCWNGMVRALNFADNQVLRKYGFIHPDLLDSSTVTPVPFDYPA